MLCSFCGTKAFAETEYVPKMYYEIHASARNGDLEKVEELLKKGVDPKWKGAPFSTTPLLHRAIKCMGTALEQNQVAIIKLLLEEGFDPNVVSNQRKDSALILLSYCKSNVEVIEVAELLISYGADPSYKNQEGYSAFSLSVFRGNEVLATFLAPLSEIDDVDIERAMLNHMKVLLENLIKSDFKFFKYPLMKWAIWNDFDDVLISLLDAGANPSQFTVNNKNYIYPIILAAHYKKNRAVKTLHRYGAYLDVIGNKERTVRNIATKQSNVELMSWLDSLESTNQ